MALLGLAARFKDSSAGAWRYPPAFPGAPTFVYERDIAGVATVTKNTVPILSAEKEIVTINTIDPLRVGTKKESANGYYLNVTVETITLQPNGHNESGYSKSDRMYFFLRRLCNAPIKEISYDETTTTNLDINPPVFYVSIIDAPVFGAFDFVAVPVAGGRCTLRVVQATMSGDKTEHNRRKLTINFQGANKQPPTFQPYAFSVFTT